jgi:chemotaxis protein CheC
MTIAELDQARRDRLLLICREGAGGAGSALATFVGKPDASLDVEMSEADSAEALAKHVAGEEAVVVGFELSGDAGGVLVAMLSAAAARRVAGSLLGTAQDDVDLADPRVHGALSEVGNIVASAFLNAMSSVLGAPCLPSVPDLNREEGGAAVKRALDRASASLDEGAMLLEVTLGAEPELTFELGFIPDGPVLDRLGDQPAA